MDHQINTNANGTLELTAGTENTVVNNIIISLAIAKGSWWFDPAFGSELYKLRRAKATAGSAAQAKQYIEAALKWLIDAGRLTSFEVTTEAVSGRVNYTVSAVQPNGQGLSYSNFVEVA